MTLRTINIEPNNRIYPSKGLYIYKRLFKLKLMKYDRFDGKNSKEYNLHNPL